MRRIRLLIAAALLAVAVATPANATHSLGVTTIRKAILLSPTTVFVNGTLTCVGAAETGSVGVVLIQPPGGVTLNGGGSVAFSCAEGETISWAVVVRANEFSTFAKGRARFDTFATTDCSDEEVDCPSVGDDGVLRIKATSRS